jgi:hypothetical protein
MSMTCVRRLIAGTVNPETSPRPRARYSSLMLADGDPSTIDASHTIQRAASTTAASSLNVADHATVRMPWSRNAASSSITSESRSTWATPSRAWSSSATEVAGVGWLMRIGPPGNDVGEARLRCGARTAERRWWAPDGTAGSVPRADAGRWDPRRRPGCPVAAASSGARRDVRVATLSA